MSGKLGEHTFTSERPIIPNDAGRTRKGHATARVDHPTAQNCLGHPWRVTLLDLNTNNPVDVDANVILLRHGIPALPFADAAEQLLHDGPRPVPPTHLYGT